MRDGTRTGDMRLAANLLYRELQGAAIKKERPESFVRWDVALRSQCCNYLLACEFAAHDIGNAEQSAAKQDKAAGLRGH
jgi:hypothetical protein